MKIKSSITSNIFVLILIFFVALLLRLIGINHGYPFIFHPDESTIVRSALGVRFEANPKHFDWPHFYIYLNFILYSVFSILRRLFSPEVFTFIYNDSWIFYLLTRIFTAILGSLTVFSIYLTGYNLFSKKVGIFSAICIALMPFHIWHSHYSLTDVPMVFLLSIALYFSSKIITSNNLKYYLLSGLFVGLSASTKYNGGLSAFMVPLGTLVFYLERLLLNKKKTFSLNILYKEVVTIDTFKKLSLSGIFALFGFLIGTPFALFDYDTFSRTDGPKGAFWQFKNVGSVDYSMHIFKFFDDMVHKLTNDSGYTIFISFIFISFISIYLIYKKIYKDNIRILYLSLLGMFLIWYISGFEKSRSHYYMISYPFIVLCAGYFSNILFNVKSFTLKFVSLFLMYSIPLYYSVLSSINFALPDTRVELYNWLRNEKSITSIVYDFNDLDLIFDKYKDIKGYNGFNNLTKLKQGYLVITSEDEFFDSRYNLELIKSISSKNSRGPEINIYKFSKIEK